MNQRFDTLLRWTVALACLAGGAGASVVSVNVTNPSTSEPKLNAAGNAWEPFSVAQGVPNASKSIKLLYLADDGSPAAFPLNAAAAAVTLRPTTAGASVACTHNPSAPVLTGSNAGTCTFRMTSTGGLAGDTLEIFYLGMLQKNGNIRITASGVTAAVGGHTVPAYDSDAALPGTPPSPTLARKKARLVLVFDKSGSMGWSSKPDGDPVCGAMFSPAVPCKRWEVLRRAAGEMATVAKAYHLPEDQLGVVFFDHDASNTGGVVAMSEVTLNAVATEIGARSPGGATSIGDGLENLQAALVGADNADFTNTMLLFTDGAQNTSKFSVWDGVDMRINATNSPVGGSLLRPAGKQLTVCPFRLRLDDPADPDASSLLATFASYSGCGALNSSTTLDNPPVDAVQYFLQVLNATLIGDKLELVQVSKGVQAATGTGPPAPLQMTFKTSRRDVAFTLLLSWDPGFQAEGRPQLKLSKDGVDFDLLNDPNVRVQSGNGHIALTLRHPYCNIAAKCVKPEGNWTLGVQRTLPRGNGAWGFTVIGDNATLASTFKAAQATPGVGQPLQLTATLTEGGVPLAGLAGGTVRAFVQAPAAGLGNVLAASKLPPGAQGPVDPTSAAGRKVRAMLADPAERAKILAALQLGAEQGIPLVETAPGVYSAPFPATVAEGVYRVTFRIDSSSGGNGAFTRVFSTDAYVPVQPDDAATAKTLEVVRVAQGCAAQFAGGCMRLTLRPVDAAGNLVGPGKASAIFPNAASGVVMVGEVVDALDGRYTLTLGYTQADARAPALQIAGLTLNLPAKAAPGNGLPWWWLLVLLLILLLAVILVLWRRRA